MSQDINHFLSWSEDDVYGWMTNHFGLETADRIRERRVNGEGLVDISVETLQSWQIPEAHAREIASLFENNPVIKFKRLIKHQFPKPITNVIDTIAVNFNSQMISAVTQNAAVSLYIIVQRLPGTTTKAQIDEMCHISISSPLTQQFGLNILSGSDHETGRPLTVKMIAPNSYEGSVAQVIKRFETSKPLVPCEYVSVQLPNKDEHTTALTMPHYPTALSYIAQLKPNIILKGGKRMEEALNALHSTNNVHMDVKPSNIFIDMNGDWFLGDYGSCVLLGNRIISATPEFCYTNFSGESKKEYDWFMLLATLMKVLDDRSLILPEVRNVDVPLLVTRIEEVSNEELKAFLRVLLQKSHAQEEWARLHSIH